MLNRKLDQQRRITEIVILVLLIAVVITFLLAAPVSPLYGDLRAEKSENPVPAEGVWGIIGFYERAADNNTTYCLMLMFFSLAFYKIIRAILLPKGQRGNQTLRRERTGRPRLSDSRGKKRNLP